MKRFIDDKGSLVISAVVLIIAFLVCAFFINEGFKAEAVIGGIGNVTASNNPHNLSASSLGINAVSERQICIFCHTPHFAIKDASFLDGPLWNHSLSSATYTVSNAPGTSGTQKSEPLKPPDGTSRMCLSCHDGTVALGTTNIGNIPMDTTHSCLDSQGRLISGSGCAFIGTDISAKHLVSIPLNDELIANKVLQCDNFEITEKVKYPWEDSGIGDAQPNTVLLRPTASTYLGNPGISGDSAISRGAPINLYKSGYNYGVQCSTCHDPHFWVNGGHTKTTAGDYFLVTSFNNLCKACHPGCF